MKLNCNHIPAGNDGQRKTPLTCTEHSEPVSHPHLTLRNVRTAPITQKISGLQFSILFVRRPRKPRKWQMFLFHETCQGVVIRSLSRTPVSMDLNSALHMQSVMDPDNHILLRSTPCGHVYVSCSIHETSDDYESKSLHPTLFSSMLWLRIIRYCKSLGVQPLNVRGRLNPSARCLHKKWITFVDLLDIHKDDDPTAVEPLIPP